MKLKWWRERGTCSACSTPEGYTLYLLIEDDDVSKMRELGYMASRSMLTPSQQLKPIQQVLN